MQIGIEAIRALFGAEKPPVLDVEWDEAGYVEQRLRAYRDALDALALVLTIPHEGDDLGAASQGGATMRCVRTGDRAVVDLGDLGDIGESDDPMGNAVRADVGRALHRVFADANAWRRSLLPAYFERHRAWRSIAGGPIQH